VQAAKGFAAKISLLEEFFSHRYRNRDTRATQYITKLVKSPTTELSVKGLGETTQLSERQLERLFAEQVGIPPRTYLKISRFQRVVSLFTQRQLLDARPALLPLALEAGYYDQSHFIRDCKQLTGLTPEAYFSTMDPLLSGSYNT
jgi:AraC-like DNA-binding protein